MRKQKILSGAIIIIWILAVPAFATDLQLIQDPTIIDSDFQKWQFDNKKPVPEKAGKMAGPYWEKDWASIIDDTWGPGLSYEEHLDIWSTFWDVLDGQFACFDGLETTIWDDIRDLYYPQVFDTVSRGRLSAIVDHACRRLSDTHTRTFDPDVFFTALDPGVPLLIYGAWGNNGHFGAGLTVMPDSSLLVYKAAENHPLGLVPGDLVLGYDGVPWKDIYPYLIDQELPLAGYGMGSCEESYNYSFLISAGYNWHLFDTIDVVKYDTGDTLHLGTDALVGQNMSIWATEQIEVPGVAMPDLYDNEITSWGIVDGTNVGYIYSQGWLASYDSATIVNTWYNALDSLQNYYNVDGVILDFRTNFGVTFPAASIFDYFFDSDFEPIEQEIRCYGGGHFDLCSYTGLDHWFDIHGDDGHYWDKPIAILTGPGASSGGDIYAMILAQHPQAKVFGRPSAGAFSGGWGYYLTPAPSWSFRIAAITMYAAINPSEYLPRATFPSSEDFPWVNYENVWLTRDGVAQGRDDVAEAAIAWIQNCCLHHGLPGDANSDGSINLLDILFQISYVYDGEFGDPPNPDGCDALLDVNGDDAINLLDILHLISHVYDGEFGEPPNTCPQ